MTERATPAFVNIGPLEQRKRRRFGALMVFVAVTTWSALVATGVDRWWRLLVFMPLAAGVAGALQAREKT